MVEKESPQIEGETPASRKAWSERLYDHLRSQAAYHLRGERIGHTLQPTALINEAYLRLAATNGLESESRTRFLAVASTTFRRVLVDHARRRRSQKRSPHLGVCVAVTENVEEQGPAAPVDVLVLNELLLQLDQIDERAGRIVEFKFFGGFSNEQISRILEVSRSTVEADWRFARAWLLKKLTQ